MEEVADVRIGQLVMAATRRAGEILITVIHLARPQKIQNWMTGKHRVTLHMAIDSLLNLKQTNGMIGMLNQLSPPLSSLTLAEVI